MPATSTPLTPAATEADPEAVGLTAGDRRADLGRRRSTSTAPASTPRCSSACGATARSCSTARSATRAATAPRTRRHAEGPGHHRHAVLRLLGLEGDDRDRRPPARRARCALDRGPGRRLHPGVRAPRQGGDHDRPRARPPRRRRRRCRGGARPRPLDDREFLVEPLCDAKPSPARASCSPTTRSRAASSSARSSTGSPARTSARCWPTRSSSRSASAGPTTASRPRTSTRSALTTSPAPPMLPPLSTLLTRALGAPARRARRVDQRPALHHRDRPGGERGHHRERALALLRDPAPRRRARRRPGDASRRRSRRR